MENTLSYDHNLAYACVGYGAMRALRARHQSGKRFVLPACDILETPDPVEFCVEAMRVNHPDWAAAVDAKTRLAIHSRLTSEAMRASC